MEELSVESDGFVMSAECTGLLLAYRWVVGFAVIELFGQYEKQVQSVNMFQQLGTVLITVHPIK